jgi:hypothetical protein
MIAYVIGDHLEKGKTAQMTIFSLPDTDLGHE